MLDSISLLKNRTFNHTLFWLLYCLSWILMDMLYGISFERAFYRYLGCILEIPFYYIHMYYLWPKFINKNQFLYYFLSITPLLLISTVLVKLYGYYIEYPVLLKRTSLPDNFFSFPNLVSFSRSILLWFGLPTVIKITRDWYKNKINLEAIQKEQKITELNFLKSQINPHFLFNTLNNLYSLSLKESKKTPEALLQLSNILSYTLYEGTEDKIAIEKEIQHLNDYIELERLRFGNRLNIEIEITGNLKYVMITPLILIPIVENAFKHCSLNERGNVDIQIRIAVNQKTLHISTINSVGKSNGNKGVKNGIGVQNIAKRLKIPYPDKHTFTLEERTRKFYVDLIIQL